MDPDPETQEFLRNSRVVRRNGQRWKPFLISEIMKYEDGPGKIVVMKNGVSVRDKDLKPLLVGGVISDRLVDFLLPDVVLNNDPIPICLTVEDLFSLGSGRIKNNLVYKLKNSKEERLILLPIVRFGHCAIVICNRQKQEATLYDSWPGDQMFNHAKGSEMKLENLLNTLIHYNYNPPWIFSSAGCITERRDILRHSHDNARSSG